MKGKRGGEERGEYMEWEGEGKGKRSVCGDGGKESNKQRRKPLMNGGHPVICACMPK